MNENHKRHIEIAYRHIDELLREAVGTLSEADKDSPFCRIALDTAPVQHRVIADYTRRIRALMLDALDRFGIAVETPHIPASRSALINLMSAEIDLDELDPKRLLGYGALSPEDAQSLAETNAEIVAVLGQMSAFLGAGADANLESRVSRLHVPVKLGDLLQALARAITAHGLVTLRPSLERLVGETESASLEIAVFGRVSSGKSSLLNRVLGRTVLPIGVTPVTALVTHVAYGLEERVTVRFAAERPVIATIADLPRYVTEQGNPSNSKQVTSVWIELPDDRLREGVTFVDTPGLGSLASSGASETMAYLPRADLGVLLSDATAPLTPEDVAVVEKLVRSGSKAAVVLSKADLLTADERFSVRAYVTRHLSAELGYEVPVHLVSVMGPTAVMADEWFETEIRPLFAVHHELKAQSLARKAEVLRRNVEVTLRARAEGGRLKAEAVRTHDGEPVEQAFRHALGVAEKGFEKCQDLVHELPRTTEGILSETAERLARSRRLADAAITLEAVTRECVQRADERIVSVVEEARTTMVEALAVAARQFGAGPEPADLPSPRGLPVFDGTALGRGLALREPGLGFLSMGIRKAGLLSQMRVQVKSDLGSVLHFHQHRIEKWCQGMFSDLKREFQGKAGPFRARIDGMQVRGAMPPDELDKIQADIRALSGLRIVAESEGAPPTAGDTSGPLA